MHHQVLHIGQGLGRGVVLAGDDVEVVEAERHGGLDGDGGEHGGDGAGEGALQAGDGVLAHDPAGVVMVFWLVVGEEWWW